MIPSAGTIVATTMIVTGVDPRGGRMNRTALLSRRVAVYSLRVMRNMSYPEIGVTLSVTHSTAMYAYRKAQQDTGVLAVVGQVRRMLDADRA